MKRKRRVAGTAVVTERVRLTTPFGVQSTATEIVAGVECTGQHFIVTGAASGIGLPTATALARTGAHLTLAVRDVQAGARVAAEITLTTGNPLIDVRRLDLADRLSIAEFVDGWRHPLHVLVNNAGVMALPRQHTSDGWEMQFAINHLGHLALALGLRSALRDSGGARIVSVSSSAHQMSDIHYDDIHFARRTYDPLAAYGQSKTANCLFAVAVTDRWAADGIFSNALMPGAIPTNLQRHLGGMKTPVELRKTPDQGAATSVLLAVSPLLAGIGGRYFADCNEAELLPEGARDLVRVASYAIDRANAERLWQVSLALLGQGA